MTHDDMILFYNSLSQHENHHVKLRCAIQQNESLKKWQVATPFHPNDLDLEAWCIQKIQDLKQEGIVYISYFHETYPEALRRLVDFPIGLFCRGDTRRLSDPLKVAVVGTRKPTKDGLMMCHQLGRFMGPFQVCLVSGLAFGIDAAVHRSALDHACPTIAVLASGVDQITPRTHQALGQHILDSGGLIISEYPPATKVLPHHYVRRNRIVSGLSDKVFIVEGSLKSGSMTTAKHALNQNKELYAMPGSIRNHVASGTNHLIRQGAYCVLDPLDLLVGYVAIEDQRKPLHHPILDLLKHHGSLSVEDLSKRLNMTFHQVLSDLTELEMEGYVTQTEEMIHLNDFN